MVSLRRALESESERLVLLCSDKDLCKAARKEGIEFIDPEEKDALQKLSAVLG